ncbi:MAG: helix-turn-helix transcriptional regulator [Ectothiorhodospiraceae bacterium]|nr:helix-turn-helix transcriptional regulator [Ectothiorhodospiraceae bacterium]
MPTSKVRTYSLISHEAVHLISNLIKVARKERQYTAQEVAERAGISRGLLQRIEKGDLKCSIGAVFEVAAIVGVKLFDAEATTLMKHILHIEEKLALLPKSVHKRTKVVDDDF